MYDKIQGVLPMFQFEGAFMKAVELNSGIINNSYHLIYQAADGRRHYTLQHINGYVFKDPVAVMANIQIVTDYLTRSLAAEGLDPSRRVLRLVPTRDGAMFYRDQAGAVWRAYDFILGATAYDRPRHPSHFYQVGRAFGQFQRRLCGFDASLLTPIIPDFHHTPRRYDDFVRAVDEDRAGRAAGVGREIDAFHARRPMMGQIVSRLEAGSLPVRVTHNDTKINNVLLDDETHEALCVIDLDTVMPGSSLYDFGDAVRYGASTAPEDEEEVSRIALDMDQFTRFAKGFFQETNGFLRKEELESMPLGVKVITCELAMRFLTDYLDGDRYFKVKYPTHNLVRARAQLALLADAEKREAEMAHIIQALL